MNFTFEQVISILGLLAMMFGQAIVLTRYLVGKQDELAKALRAELAQQVITRDNALAMERAARELAVAELHRRMDMFQKSMHDFREHVGIHYVTHDSMRDVEARLSIAITASESRLTALFSKLEERLERSQHRGPAE